MGRTLKQSKVQIILFSSILFLALCLARVTAPSSDAQNIDRKSGDGHQQPQVVVPKWIEQRVVNGPADSGRGRNAPGRSSEVCDVAVWSAYRYAAPSSVAPSGEPAAETCSADDTSQQQHVVVESINKKVLEVLPEVEKVNFASASDGAKVLASSAGAKRVGALLDEDTDTFMRTECKDDDKWVVVELSQMARVSLIEISQYELYSSRVNEFVVYGMQSHPRTLSGANTNGWHLLGKFAAAKKKGKQSFSIVEGANGSVDGVDPRDRWVRYLLIRFLSHHGGESVCAINEIGVYGVSAAAELEAQLAMEDEDGAGVEGIISGSEGLDGETGDVVGEDGIDVGSGTSDADGSKGADVTGSSAEDTSVMPVDLGEGEAPGTPTASIARPVRSNSTRVPTCHVSSGNAMYDEQHGVCDGSVNSTGVHGKNGAVHPSDTAGDEEMKVDAVASNQDTLSGTESESPSTPGSTASSSPTSSIGDIQIPSPSKKGSNLYETLVQELRGTKAQQKAITKSFDMLAKNFELLSEDLSALMATSGMYGSGEVDERILKLERRLDQMGRLASAHSNAAVGMLASVMGYFAVQYLESMNDAGSCSETLTKSKSTGRMLSKLASLLVALNAVVAAGLVIKGAIAVA